MTHTYEMYNPLFALYKNGPLFMGFWGGKQDSEICASLTNVQSSLWNMHNDECIDLIHKHYNSFAIVVYIVALFYILSKLFSYICFYILCVRPLQKVFITQNVPKLKQ